MAGLRELWALGEPAAPTSVASQSSEQEKQAFVDAIRRLNASLQFTAAHAPPLRHVELVQRRDQLFSGYQEGVVSAWDDAAPLQVVLEQARRLENDARQLAQSTRDLKQRWEKQQPTLESTEDVVAQASANEDVAPLHQGLVKANDAAKRRDYLTACNELDAVAAIAQKATSTMPGGAPSPPAVNERRYPLQGRLDADPVVPTDRRALEDWTNPLIDGDPKRLFEPAKMDQVVDMHFAGEGTSELNTAMKAVLFAKPRDDVSKHLAEIGRLRGLDPAVVQQQFERFQQLQSVSKQLETARELPPDEVVVSRTQDYLQTHGDFLGTQSSLRFGQVVGEATGLDPAFAAMLNPTGGMVGPGMDVLAPTDADSPIIWHGIFHDAGGYLLNYQNTGPGYAYLADAQPASGRRAADPIQGQVEGVSYWYERKQPERSVLEDLYEPDLTAEDPERRQLAYDRFVRNPILDSEELVNGLTEDTVDAMQQATRGARRLNQESVASLKNTTRDAADAVQRRVDEADATLDKMVGTARDLGVDEAIVDVAQQAIRAKLQTVHEQVEDWEEGVASRFESAGEMVDQDLQEFAAWTDGASEAVRRKTGEAANEVEEEIRAALIEAAHDKDLQQTLTRSVNFVAESKQDVDVLVDVLGQEVESAKSQVEAFYDDAFVSISQRADQVADDLAAAKDDLIGKLSVAKQVAADSVEQLERQVDRVAGSLSEAQQDIVDAASGVADSMGDAVSGGANALANVTGSATEFAAARLDCLTNLLG